MIIDCFQNQNLKNSQMSCLVTAVLEITECFYRFQVTKSAYEPQLMRQWNIMDMDRFRVSSLELVIHVVAKFQGHDSKHFPDAKKAL